MTRQTATGCHQEIFWNAIQKDNSLILLSQVINSTALHSQVRDCMHAAIGIKQQVSVLRNSYGRTHLLPTLLNPKQLLLQTNKNK